MTDDELLARLRAETDGATVNPDGPEAADRIEALIRERDKARAYGTEARIRENTAEDARVSASFRALEAEAEVARLRAAVQKAQRPEGETIDGVVSWIKEDAERLATVRAAIAEDTP